MTKTPLGWPLMAEAFLGLAHHSIADESVLAAFQLESGLDLKTIIPKAGLDKLIDQATGRTEEALGKFLDWLVVNQWGEEPQAQE